MNELEATRAKLKCLEMVEGTGLDWWKVVRHHKTGDGFNSALPFSCERCDYEFALGIVEGKPVWEGDILYNDSGYNYCASQAIFNGTFRTLSWNPPAPKTVMVEMLVEDANDMAYQRAFDSTRIAVACRKALEQIK